MNNRFFAYSAVLLACFSWGQNCRGDFIQVTNTNTTAWSRENDTLTAWDSAANPQIDQNLWDAGFEQDPLISFSADGDNAMTSGNRAFAESHGSAVGVTLDAAQAQTSLLTANSSVIVSSTFLTNATGTSASGGPRANANANANGNYVVNGAAGQLYGIVYASVLAEEKNTGGGTFSSASTAIANAGGGQVIIDDNPVSGFPTQVTITGGVQIAAAGLDGLTQYGIVPFPANSNVNTQAISWAGGTGANGSDISGFGLAVGGAWLVVGPAAPAPLSSGPGVASSSMTTGLQFGDVDFDFTVGAGDIDTISNYLNTITNNSVFPTDDGLHHGASPLYDLSVDQEVTTADRDVLIRSILGTEYGDFDFDGDIDISDFNAFSAGYGAAGGYADGDLDGSGFVDLNDFGIFSDNYGYLAGQLGDFSSNGFLDAADIDVLYANLGGGPEFDLTNDAVVDQADVDELVTGILSSNYGDANLDGVVDDVDKSILFASYFSSGGWSDGDFSGDGFVDSADYTIWRDHEGYGAATAVPEASSLVYGLSAIILLAKRLRNS